MAELEVDVTALRELFLTLSKDKEAGNRLFLQVYLLCELVSRRRTYPLLAPDDEDEEMWLIGRSRSACARYFGEIAIGWEPLSLSAPGPFLGGKMPDEAGPHDIDDHLSPARGGRNPASEVLISFISAPDVGHGRNAMLRTLEEAPEWRAVFSCINEGIDRRTAAPWAQEHLRQLFRLVVQDFLRLHAVSMLLGDPMAESTEPIVGMLHECVPLLARHDPLRLVVLIG